MSILKHKRAFSSLTLFGRSVRIQVYLNIYAGIVWCFGKQGHAGRERLAFGKVGYVNAKGI